MIDLHKVLLRAADVQVDAGHLRCWLPCTTHLKTARRRRTQQDAAHRKTPPDAADPMKNTEYGIMTLNFWNALANCTVH